ncbi:histone protein [Streptomyces sp. NPDC088341]|uniref:histone protein n=1 Tax=Streptomyces sp. NPDC088341 TaxID=3154870 RepID=UPI003445AE7F
MDRRTKVAVASAVLGGYVLGRTKKGRLALTVATFVAGKGLGLDPKRLVTEGVQRLGEIPQVAQLQEQVREEGIDAARGALSAVVGRGVGSLSDSISSRAVNLGGKQKEPDEDEVEEEEEGAEEPEDEFEDEDEESEEEEPEDEPPPPSGRRRTGESDAPRRGSRTGRAPDKSAAPAARAAKKPVAGRGVPGGSAVKKTAAPRKKATNPSPTRDSRRR